MNKQIVTLLFLLWIISIEVTINKITLGVLTNLLECINILTKNVLKIADYKPLGQDSGSVTKSSRCRGGGIRDNVPGSPEGKGLRVSESRAVSGAGTLHLGASPLLEFHILSHYQCQRLLTGRHLWRDPRSHSYWVSDFCRYSSSRFQVTKCSSTCWTRFSPDPGDAGHGAENPPPAAAGGAGPDRDLGG